MLNLRASKPKVSGSESAGVFIPKAFKQPAVLL